MGLDFGKWVKKIYFILAVLTQIQWWYFNESLSLSEIMHSNDDKEIMLIN